MGRGKFLRSLRLRWWMLFLIVVPITLGTFVYSEFIVPTLYEGFITVADKRDIDINIPPIYPDQAFGRGVNEQEIRVINLANTVGSYSVLKAAFDELVQLKLKEPGSASERRFFRDVEIVPLRGSEFLSVSYIGKNLEESKIVIETIRDKLLHHYSNLNYQVAERHVRFIEEQLNEQKALYEKKLQEQKEFMEMYPQAAGFEVNTSGLVSRYNTARANLMEALKNEAVAAASLAHAKSWAGRPETEPVELVANNPNPIYNDILGRIKNTETALAVLEERYGPNHPSVIQAKQTLESDRKLLSETPKYFVTSSNPEVGQLESERIRNVYTSQQALSAARAEVARSRKEVAQLQAELDRLPVIQKELTRLNAEIRAQAETVTNLVEKVEEAKIRAKQHEIRGLYFLDDPQVKEVDRRTVLKTLIAFFLSSVVAISLIASLGQFDQSTYTPLEAENSLGFPVLAALPRSGQQRINPELEAPTPLAASYQILSTQLMTIKEKLNGPGILVAAAEPNSGRSTVASNLAISLARDGSRVLLVDADLRSPSLHEHFGLENRAGLAEVLSGQASLEQVIQATGVEGLLFLAAGQPPVNPVRLFHSEAMEQLIEQISKGVDFVIFDSPSGSTFGDSLVLAELVQNVILVHEAGRPASMAEYDFHKSLERMNVNIIGLVLNKTRLEDSPSFQHYRRNYAAAISRYHPTAARAALTAGQKKLADKPKQYGAPGGDEEE